MICMCKYFLEPLYMIIFAGNSSLKFNNLSGQTICLKWLMWCCTTKLRGTVHMVHKCTHTQMYLCALYKITPGHVVLIFSVFVCIKGDSGGLVWWEGAKLDPDHWWNGFCTPWCHAWGTWEPTCLCLCPCECVFLPPPHVSLFFWVWLWESNCVVCIFVQFIFPFTCMLFGWCFLVKQTVLGKCEFLKAFQGRFTNSQTFYLCIYIKWPAHVQPKRKNVLLLPDLDCQKLHCVWCKTQLIEINKNL